MSISIRIGNVRKYMPMIRKLAEEVYDLEDVSPLQKYLDIYDVNPDSFICAFDDKTNQVVGYIIAPVLNPEYFEITTKMDYEEQGFSKEVIKPYTKGNNDVYFFSIVSKRTHPNRIEIFSKLSKAYVEQIQKLATQGIYIMRASAVALSESGIKICQGLQMEEIGVNPKGTVFYNPSFHKIYIKGETKESVVRNFILARRQQKAMKFPPTSPDSK